MITFFFENGCVATLRGSGTGTVAPLPLFTPEVSRSFLNLLSLFSPAEPKLKYYIEHHGPYGYVSLHLGDASRK